MVLKGCHPPPSYGSSKGYSYIVFLWLPKYSYRVFLRYPRVALQVTARYSYKVFIWLPKYPIRVFLWLPRFPTLQVTNPMDVIPTEYSYGCPSKGAHSHAPCLGLIYFFIHYSNANCKTLRVGSTLL